MVNFKATLPLVLLLTILFTSCEKKFLEVVPVMQIEQDLSIDGASDIKYFSFPSQQVGYAAGNTPYIYKTTDAGNSWTKINVGTGGKCQGLEFYDAMNGMCLMGEEVYKTENGGQSWTRSASGQFIGLTDDGKGVIGSCSYLSCQVYVSSDRGQTFQPIGQVTKEGEFRQAFITSSKVFVVGNRTNQYNSIYGIDTGTRAQETLVFDNMTYDEVPSGLFINEYSKVLVGSNGQILERDSYDNYNRTYYGHTYPYFTVDGYNDLVVVAGERTVSVNIDFGEGDKWSELLDRNGRSFPHSFYKVKFINQNSFYISGSNGLLWRAKI